jgi:hypothetical protein
MHTIALLPLSLFCLGLFIFYIFLTIVAGQVFGSPARRRSNSGRRPWPPVSSQPPMSARDELNSEYKQDADDGDYEAAAAVLGGVRVPSHGSPQLVQPAVTAAVNDDDMLEALSFIASPPQSRDGDDDSEGGTDGLRQRRRPS